jgi:hypothetical protein
MYYAHKKILVQASGQYFQSFCCCKTITVVLNLCVYYTTVCTFSNISRQGLESTYVSSSLGHKYLTRVEVPDSEKHSNLL